MPDEQIILLVEDNDDDAELTVRAFREARIDNPMVRLEDGVAAIEYLLGSPHETSGSTPPTQRALPAVVLLDLNLPRASGLEVLKAVRADARARHLPIVILTSSTEDADRFAAYDHHANSYVQKPVDYQAFVAAARQLGLYWTLLNVATPRVR